MDSNKLNSVVLFSAIRKLKNLTSVFLTTLEARIIYIKQLENTFIKMGVGDYENSIIDYQRDRKHILDTLNTAVRELEEIQKLVCDSKDVNNDNKNFNK
jgi:hypothetical protein